nr:hypothetical protein CFP56_49651 [Quercus suber]
MRATMERFYKSQPIIKQEGANSDQTNQMPQKASSTLRLTVLTEDEDIRTKDTIGNKDAMHADDEEVIPLPTNKDIITDPALFSTHLQEIDKDLNLFTNEPTLTSEGVFVSQGEGPSTCDPIMASKALDKEKLLSSHCKHGSHVAVKPMNKIDDAVSGNENLTGTWKRKPQQQNKSKEVTESMLMKRVNRDSDEEMEDAEGSRKRRAADCNAVGTPMYVATKKLKKCKKMLKAWDRDHFGSVKDNIKKLKDQLWKAEMESVRSGSYEEAARIKFELSVLESSVSRVSDLFYPDTRIWDPGKLEENFYPWEAELISRIQVSDGNAEDLLVWPLTSDGSFSVRSANRFLALADFSSQPSSSSGIEQQNFWKNIWKIRAPNRIKHFIWRAARDALPT